MLDFKRGMSIKMNGPVGSFYLKDNHPTLLVAGGIGITPFRSMVKQMDVKNMKQKIELLYMDRSKEYVFKNELDSIANNTYVNVAYLHSRKELFEKIDAFITDNKNDGKYFISGPKEMVSNIVTYIQKGNISKRNIKKDMFIGY